MEYFAKLDVSLRTVTVCAVDADGRVILERSIASVADRRISHGNPNLPAIRAFRPTWNKGRIVGQKQRQKPKHFWAIQVRLELAENHRDLALFNMACLTAREHR